VLFLFDQVYIKHIISTVEMTSWSRVYYQNILAALPMCIVACTLESAPLNLCSGWVGPTWLGVSIIAISCGMGCAMSFFSFKAREALTATGFTVVGNTCKVLSVFVNVLIWDKHATAGGLFALCFCVVGGIVYKPANLRAVGARLPSLLGSNKLLLPVSK